MNDAQRETASLSRYAAVHVLRPERADTGGACQLPVFRQGDGDKSERCGADGPVCALPCGVRSRSDDDEGRAAQCAVRMDSEDVGGARGAGEGCGMKAERHQARNSSGACVLSQSANAASIRVCQPLPVSRKALTTEGESRSDNAILVGRFCGPRTPNFLSKEGGNTSYAGRARAKSSSIISGLGFFVAFDLSRIGFTKTNHSNTALCFDKYKGVQTLIEQPKRPIAYFTVVTPVIDFKKSGFEIEILGPFKRQLALCNVAFVLFGVKGNVH